MPPDQPRLPGCYAGVFKCGYRHEHWGLFDQFISAEVWDGEFGGGDWVEVVGRIILGLLNSFIEIIK